MEQESKAVESRRELKSRNTSWAQLLAKKLAGSHISPNQISVMSVFFAGVSLAAYYASEFTDSRWYLILAAVGIQMRLICNLMDGMVAIEFNKKSKVGDLYNEIPDRIGDALIILGVGLYLRNTVYGLTLAWANIFMATLTAYVRVLGASLGKGHKFIGPMAKQHRMFLLTVATVLETVIPGYPLYIALAIMAIGLIITNARRITGIAKALEEK
ncbi:CDP-alcohol phosphatidyltransferase family protein [Bdellovibrio sp. SKB1291214]|uniref:CDP-alcohol phosphatidyltransferase family protein n=1 Tax=Bdellovibrio sp. SKB1291214 TaxID=1732569 RepID=UPI00223FF177|nr:CDP-alcohol phosphatidyltransferase family protein [Bdellovibrio sp. SKB1291214]UYL09199.1 CDP-alcohol phosphatidyltransferase family protein [Bdellovibrio sp. SKB1291214]